jgi:hypothetical protein
MEPTYKVVKVPQTSGEAWGIVTATDGMESLNPVLYETEAEAQAEVDRRNRGACPPD